MLIQFGWEKKQKELSGKVSRGQRKNKVLLLDSIWLLIELPTPSQCQDCVCSLGVGVLYEAYKISYKNIPYF